MDSADEYEDINDEPEFVDDWDDNTYIIESVLRRRHRKAEDVLGAQEYEYEIKWKGFDESENTWCTQHELYDIGAHNMKLVAKFDESLKQKKKEKEKSKEKKKSEDTVSTLGFLRW